MSCASHKPQIGWTVLKEVITFSVASGRGFAVEHQDLFGKDASPVNGPTLTRWPPRFPLRRRESIGRGVQVVSTGDEETAPGRPGSHVATRALFAAPPVAHHLNARGLRPTLKHASPRLSANPTEPSFLLLFLSERSSVSGRADSRLEAAAHRAAAEAVESERRPAAAAAPVPVTVVKARNMAGDRGG